METPFDKIFPDREKEENLDEVSFKFQRNQKKVHVYDVWMELTFKYCDCLFKFNGATSAPVLTFQKLVSLG